LREKSKMLEDKLKLLRVKEVEFRRVTLSKDKAAKEVLYGLQSTVLLAVMLCLATSICLNPIATHTLSFLAPYPCHSAPLTTFKS
jgi:hypothetical protein